jgi:hypothetical protein
MLTLSLMLVAFCSTYPKSYIYWVHKPKYTRIILGWVITGLDFSGPRLRSWSFFRFCVSIFFLAFLSVHCVSPHRRFHKPRRISTLKTKNIIVCAYLLDHNLSLSMDRQFKKDCKMVSRLKISSISPMEKYFYYIPYLYHLFARGRATSKHGGGGRYNAI